MLPELVKKTGIETGSVDKPLFGVLAHGYQPPRKCKIELILEGKSYRTGFSVLPGVNEDITDRVYKPILSEVDRLPPGLVTSIYAPLRSYLKRSRPELFAGIQEAVGNTPDREYSVLGDPLVHLILPLLPFEDQRMLLEAGKRAFMNDFGFAPKGLWLPETAMSKEVLHNAALAGYEFVPLRDSQITHIPGDIRLDAKHNVCMVQTGKNEEIAVLLGNSELSGFVSYSPWSTYDAEGFMKGRQQNEQQNGWNALMMMDLERFGHHQIGAEKFLERILNIQENYGFTPLNMRLVLNAFKQGREKTYVEVIDGSSWSCPHTLGRWTGECNCGNPSESVLQTKQEFYANLMAMNTFVNTSLDAESPGWRREFTRLFVMLADDIFTGANFGPLLFEAVKSMGGDEKIAKLYLAKMEIMTGLTSCGWFFGEADRYERDIPASMMRGVKKLFPKHFR
jgi:hypothetical protein